jgi:sodium transport system permease protein
MRFPFVMHIAYKELLSTLRDRRAIISNLLIPLLILPVMILGLPLVLGGLFQREGQAVTPLAASGLEHMPAELIALIEAQNAELITVADPMAAVRDDEFPAGFSVEEGFVESLEAGERASVSVYSKPGNMRSELNATKITTAVTTYGQGIVAERLAAAGLDPGVLEPVAVTPVDASTEAERASGMMAWLIPFFLAIWILTGGQMTAIDATAGEKERGTLEVLLVAPIRRLEVVTGKAIATMTTGLTAGIMAIMGYLAGGLILRRFLAGDAEMAEFSTMMLGSLSIDPMTILLLILSAVLLSALIANLLMGITMFAKSFKEAQSYVAPLSFLLIVPIFALQFSDFFAFGALVYLIPMLNILLAMDAVIKGTALGWQLALAWGSTLLYAGLLLAFAYRSFKREDVIFRS